MKTNKSDVNRLNKVVAILKEVDAIFSESTKLLKELDKVDLEKFPFKDLQKLSEILDKHTDIGTEADADLVEGLSTFMEDVVDLIEEREDYVRYVVREKKSGTLRTIKNKSKMKAGEVLVGELELDEDNE